MLFGYPNAKEQRDEDVAYRHNNYKYDCRLRHHFPEYVILSREPLS